MGWLTMQNLKCAPPRDSNLDLTRRSSKVTPQAIFGRLVCVACLAAGPRTRLNNFYTEGLERLQRRQGMCRAKEIQVH